MAASRPVEWRHFDAIMLKLTAAILAAAMFVGDRTTASTQLATSAQRETWAESVDVCEDVGGTADIAVVPLDTSSVLSHATVACRQHWDNLQRLVTANTGTAACRVERLQLTVVTRLCVCSIQYSPSHIYWTSISSNADGPRDAASRRIANTTLTMHTKWNHQAPTLRAILKAHCYTDRHLSVISTHTRGKAQTPLGRFVVAVLYKQVCNKYTTNRTNGAWALVHRRRWEKQRPAVDDIADPS